jgi:uncharacterized protein YjbI with pentapeptide repeats
MEEYPQGCQMTWDCIWKELHQDMPCPVHDEDPNKNIGDFRNALSQAVNLLISGNHVSLRGVIFPEAIGNDLYALLASGTIELKLAGAKFLGKVNFDDKAFNQAVEFDGAIFKQGASFQHARFFKPASFVRANVGSDAAFANTIFEESVYFDHLECQRAEFTLAQFKSMVSFRGNAGSILFREATEVILDEARFFKPDLARLAYVDFKRCSLLRTDLRGIDFSGVRWGEKGNLTKHVVLYTKEPEEQVRLELENAYRQIRQSYEDRRDYGRAGAFYFGEMEQKWKGSGGWLATLYRFSSSYGHSPGRAFVILLLLLGLDAWFVAFWGIRNISGAAYDLVGAVDGVWWSFLETWWIALWFYVLKTVTFGQPSVVPLLPVADIFSSVIRILISVQVALFVLAVNRKFKR